VNNIELRNIKFSVAMSVYKNDDPLNFDSALKSITLDQTITPTEVILIIDGPISNELNNIIEKYKSLTGLINVIRLENNLGLGNALRTAVNESKYDLIARMDADDISISTRFEQQLQYFNDYPNLDIIGGDITEFIGNEKNIVSKRVALKSYVEIQKDIKKRCPLNHVSVMFKKEAVLKAGNYIDLFWNEDYYLWIRMFEDNCIMLNTGTILVNVRIGKDMFRRRGGIKYFKSEKFLQDYMLKKDIIKYRDYIMNLIKRFILQLLLPNSIRGFIFIKYARKKI